MTSENSKGMGVTGGRSSIIKYGSEMVGYQLGGCEIVEFIGKGGMGAVYKAIQTNLNREVALKILSTPNKDGKAIEWFQREAQSIAQLEHKNIIQVYALDYSEELETFYIVMQYVDGASLDKLVKSLDGGRLPIEKALEYAIQVAEGLYSAHEKNIIHRDVKPANIMVTMDEVIKITDFGLAKSLSMHTTSSASAGLIVGTPLYMAPEQCVGTQIDARTDIYSLGASLYYLLVGRPPFMGENSYDILEKQITEAPKALSSIDPEIPEELSNIVLKMLAKNREDRYQNCAEVADELRHFINPQEAANAEGLSEEKTIYRLSGISQEQLADGLDKIINEGRKGILSVRSKEEHLFLYVENNTIYAYLENYMEEFSQKHSQLSFTEMITLLITISLSWDPFTWEFVEEEPPGEFRDYCIAARVDIFSFLRNTSTAIQIFLSLIQPGSLIIRTPIKSIFLSYTEEHIYACSPLPHHLDANFLSPEQALSTIDNILQSNYSLEYQTTFDLSPAEKEENALAGIFFQILEGCPDYSFFQGFSIFDKNIFPSTENKITITKVRELETKLGRVLQQMFEGYKKLEEIGLPKYYAILFAGAIVKEKALYAANKIGELVRTLFEKQDISIAKPLLDISLKLYRYNFKLIEEIAQGYENQGDKVRAIEYWLRCGKLREELRDFERADSCYKYASIIDTKNHVPLLNLLELYIANEKSTDDIIKVGEKLISKLRSAKETKILVDVCKRLIEIDPELLACHQELVNYYIDEGKNREAVESFERIASIYRRQENKDALIQTYHKILKMDATNEDARQRLFELEGKPVKLIRAIDSATKVIKKNSFVVNPKYTFLGIFGLFILWFGYREISGYFEFQRLKQQVEVGNFLVIQQELEYVGRNFYFSGIHAEAMSLYVAEDKKIKDQLMERNRKTLVKRLDQTVEQYKDNYEQLLKELDKIHAQYFQPQKEYLEKIVQKRIDDIRYEYAQKKKEKNEEDFASVKTLIEEKEFDKAQVILDSLRAQNFDLWNKRVEETKVILEKERQKWVSEKIVREEQQQELLKEAREYEGKGMIELAIETYKRAESLLKNSINAKRANTYRESLMKDLADTKEWLSIATQKLENDEEDDAYIYLERITSNSKLINSRFLKEAMWPTVITTSPMKDISCYDGSKFLGNSPLIYKQKFVEDIELRWQIKSVGLSLKRVERLKINGQKTWKIVLHLDRDPVWKFNTQGRIESPVLVYKDKIICASRDNRIYCINKSGEEIWKLYTGRLSEISGAMQIYQDHLFVSTLAGYVYVLDLRKDAINAKNTVVWSGRISGASFRGGPQALGLDRMAVAARNGLLLIVNQSGSSFRISKKYSLRDALGFTPIYNNGILVVTGKTKVHLVDLRNNKVRSTKSYRISGEVSTEDNRIYIPTTRGVVVSDLSGKNLDRYPSQSYVVSQPIIEKGNVYFASNNGEIFKAKINGKQYLWKQKIPSKIQVPLFEYKNVIFACGEYSIWAISKESGKIIMEYQATKEDEIYSKPNCDGEFLYFSSGKTVTKLWVKDIVQQTFIEVCLTDAQLFHRKENAKFGIFRIEDMKKILIIMVLIGFVCAKDNKITFSVYCKAYNKNLKSKALYIDKMIRQVVPQEMTNYIPAKNTLSVMRKFYKGVKPTATYLYKKFTIRPDFRKWLQSKGVDYLIICGMNVSRNPRSLILFYRILPVNSEGDETKFVRSRSWKAMQQRVAQLLEKSILAKHVTDLKNSSSEDNNKGWFGEKLPSGIVKSNMSGQYLCQKDQSTMVYVPAGPFQLSSQEIPGYYIDKYEVNNQQFCLFLNSSQEMDAAQFIDVESSHSLIEKKDGTYTPKKGCELYPVVEVSWLGAKEYCKWAGKALPSKNHWLKSFHGGAKIPDVQAGKIVLVDNPLQQRTFPWGEDAPDQFVYRCNYHPQKADADGYGWLAPTIAFDGLGDSPYFCSNMTGNVWEWCADEEAELRFCYGGSWNSSMEALKKPIEVSPQETKSDIGFRSVVLLK